MNERSTRAHTVFVLSLETGERSSRFYFADLGGSELMVKSGAADCARAPVLVVGGEELSRVSWGEYYSGRRKMLETVNINKGLFSLKKVIEALHKRSRMAKEGQPLK